MNNEPELAARVAALERQLNNRLTARPLRNVAVGFACLLLAALLTLNVWLAWSGQAATTAARLEHHFWLLCHEGATAQQRRDAFSALVRAGNEEWRSARLAYLKLQRGDFDGVNLELAEMKGCDFTQSTMVGANLRGAGLGTAKLVDVDLSLANLAEAFLLKADLSKSTVHRADLRGASLEQCTLEETDFDGSNLSEANLLLAVMTKANLTNADLSWANLEAAQLRGACLAGASFENANLRDTDFTDSNWWRAVGLPSDTMDRLKKDFAPSEDAHALFRDDYEKWLEE